jgi:TrmH family RNA methyltransferase
MPITSPHNSHLRELRKLAQRRVRDRSGRFVAEGEDLLAAADAAGWPALERYSAAGSGLPGTAVEPELLAAASQLGSGTRTLAVYEQRWAPAPSGPLCVSLHGIADPGNVGAILRSALAFGAASVALGPGCADPFGPKAVRASMGAVFSVPLARVASVPELPGETIALDAHASEPIAAVAVPEGGAVTLLVGAERTGLPADVIAACDRAVRIPIRSESLNAAMAATVALYELTRGAISAGPDGAPSAARAGDAAPDHRIDAE